MSESIEIGGWHNSDGLKELVNKVGMAKEESMIFQHKCFLLESQLAAAQAEIVRLSGKTGFCTECERQAKELVAAKAEKWEAHEINGVMVRKLCNLESETKRLREALGRIALKNGPYISEDGLADIAQAALDGGKQ